MNRYFLGRSIKSCGVGHKIRLRRPLCNLPGKIKRGAVTHTKYTTAGLNHRTASTICVRTDQQQSEEIRLALTNNKKGIPVRSARSNCRIILCQRGYINRYIKWRH